MCNENIILLTSHKLKGLLSYQYLRKEIILDDKHSFIDLLGIEFLDNPSKEVAIGQIELKEYHSQVYGNAHGGVLYSLADTVAGYLIWNNAEPEVDLVNTIEMKMNYIAKAPIGGTIKAVASLKHLGRTTGVCMIDVFHYKTGTDEANKKLVATAIATFTKLRKA